MNLIIQAARFAEEAHRGQERKYSGRPYITHPCRVAGRVAIHPECGEAEVAAAFLHDVAEDCGVKIRDLHQNFGLDVALLVEQLTNPSKQFPGWSRPEKKAIDRKHAATISREAKIIKMIDRIDNLRETLKGTDFASMYAMESLLLWEVLKEADCELAAEMLQVIRTLEN